MPMRHAAAAIGVMSAGPRVESATASLDEGRRTVGQLKVIISIECPPAWAGRALQSW